MLSEKRITMDKYKLHDTREDAPSKPREYLIDKAMKLKALLSSDEEGERDAANNILSKFMEKHQISWEELDDQVEREYFVEYGEAYHRKLLVQIVYKHVGSKHCYLMMNKDTDEESHYMKVVCKPSDFIEIQLDWEFYWRMFNQELDIFYRAFVEKNQLFPPKELQKEEDEDDNEDLSEEEIQKISRIMKGVDSYTRSKAIDTGKRELKEGEKS